MRNGQTKAKAFTFAPRNQNRKTGNEVGVQGGENVEEKGDKGVLKKRKKVLEKRKKGIPLPNFRSKKPERNGTQKNAKEFIEDIEKEKKRD